MWKFLSHSFWLTTRDFSSRKLEIFPPSGSPPRLNWISKYFPCPAQLPLRAVANPPQLRLHSRFSQSIAGWILAVALTLPW